MSKIEIEKNKKEKYKYSDIEENQNSNKKTKISDNKKMKKDVQDKKQSTIRKKYSKSSKEIKDKEKLELSNYDSSKIKALEGLEGVRMRPSMYIGDIGIGGIHHLVYELIDNSIDEALAGFCNTIIVELQPNNWIMVEDNGRGIPTGIHPEKKIPTLELIFQTLHSGGKFDKESYKISGGLHGVGLAVINALSEKVEVTIYREGKEFYQEFSKGKKLTELTQKKLSSNIKDKTGTKIRFLPDKEIFKNLDFSKEVFERERIIARLQYNAFLTPKLKIILRDIRETPYEKIFYNENGIIDFVKFLNEGKKTLFDDIIFFEGKIENVEISIAFQYCEDSYYENILGFVNNIYTENGGTHITGFKSGLTKAINYFAPKSSKKQEIKYTGNDVREGLTAIVSIKIPEPQFEGQTKGKLGNSEVKNYIEDFLYNELVKYLEKNSKIKNLILNKVDVALKGRLASQKARDFVRRKSPLEVGKLPGKLADCSSKNSEECELFIVEGDSAGGSAKEARDRRYQAVLPLRGKILNVEKAPIHKLLENNEIKALVTAIGVGISKFSFESEEDENEEEENEEDENGEKLNDAQDEDEMENEKDIENEEEEINTENKMGENELQQGAMEPITNENMDENIINNAPIEPTTNDGSNKVENDKSIVSTIKNGVKVKIKKKKKIGFDISKLRYNKIIILTDADIDGQHIKTLLLTFFFRYMTDLIRNGHVYIAVPPIYKFTYKDGNKSYEEYSYEESNLEFQLQQFCRRNNIPKEKQNKIHVQRYKGLGEMNPEQLAETTLKPGMRKLVQIKCDDLIFSDMLFSKLMGNEVGPRKEYIMEHYNKVKELDI